MTVLASVGFFASFKYRYDARMEQLEAERAAQRGQDEDEGRVVSTDSADVFTTRLDGPSTEVERLARHDQARPDRRRRC